MYREFDDVMLSSGEKASIVEVLGDGKMYIVDIKRDGDYDTESVPSNMIICKL